jgi:hypothetical protein
VPDAGNVPEDPDELSDRIKELDAKSSQLLIFLSFALVVATILGSSREVGSWQKAAVSHAMRWWVVAISPILITILPIKEIRIGNQRWYQIVRWSKFVLLWLAIGFIFVGALQFFHAI